MTAVRAFRRCKRCKLEATLRHPLIRRRMQDAVAWLHQNPEVCIAALQAFIETTRDPDPP